MARPDQIAADPHWLPHRIDPARREVGFVRFSRAELEDRAFLANQRGQEEAWLSFDSVTAMRPAAPLPGRFIFHSGFCRSTLLLQALCGSGRALGLNEPEILNGLARLPDQDPPLLGAILALLLRPHPEREAVIIKPSNFPNRLIPQIMKLLPEARAVILTNTLPAFLQAIARKGLLGRQWGRQTLLVAAEYAGDIGALRDQLAGLTDLQVAGLGWLLMQNWFDRVADPRLAVLHGESLTSAGPAALGEAAAHLGLALPADEIAAILTGPVFATDAKTGEDYAALRIRQAARAEVPVIAEEIEQVAAWIDQLAAVSGLKVPIAPTIAPTIPVPQGAASGVFR